MATKINPIVDLKDNLKPLQKKILESGLIDQATVELMEKWGNLPPGSSEFVREDALAEATKETLLGLADDLATEVEKEHSLRETYLDLERIRWPATVDIVRPPTEEEDQAAESQGKIIHGKVIAEGISAVMDRMGRYYFRIQDIDSEWFVPGFIFCRKTGSKVSFETILQKQILYIGEDPVCLQVTAQK